MRVDAMHIIVVRVRLRLRVRVRVIVRVRLRVPYDGCGTQPSNPKPMCRSHFPAPVGRAIQIAGPVRVRVN